MSTCQHGSVWGNNKNDQIAYVAQADIKKAFDNITIQVVARALEALKVHPRLTHGILESLVGTSGILCFEGLEATTSWGRSVRTGGTESPLLFNLVVLAMCAGLFKSREDLQLGCPVADILGVFMDVCRYLHALWADDIYLVATSAQDLQYLLTSLTTCFRDWGLSWKPDSLEYMIAGGATPCSF